MTETKTNGSRIARIAGRLGILVLVAVSFITGLFGAIYLSLRSPEVAVPEIVGKDQAVGRSMVEDAGLNLRVRATRFATDARANTILDQSPRPGEVIKVGQTIAVVVARSERREGEANSGVEPQPSPDAQNTEEASDAGNANRNSSNSNADAERRRDRADRNSNRNANANRNTNRNTNANANRNVNTNRNANAAGNANRANNSNRQSNANRSTPTPRPSPPAANATRARTTNANRP